MKLPVVAAATILWAVFIIWSVRRLWHEGSDPFHRYVFRYGIRGWGLPMWAVFTLFMTFRNPTALGSVWITVAATAFIYFPVCLWGGYFWGYVMARIFRVPRAPE